MKTYTVYFVNLSTGTLSAQVLEACDGIGARNSSRRNLRRAGLLESGNQYRIDVRSGRRGLATEDFPAWMFDPDHVYQTAR